MSRTIVILAGASIEAHRNTGLEARKSPAHETAANLLWQNRKETFREGSF